MVTAYGDEQLATQMLREGAVDYIVRDPSSAYLSELPKRVGEAVTRHRLQDTNNLLIAALESARDGIVIIDLHGIVLHVNSALERLFGFSRAEVMGQNASQLFRSEQQPATLMTEIWTVLHDRHSTAGKGSRSTSRKDRHIARHLADAVTSIFDIYGQMTHFVSIYRDISERKQMERQLVQAQKMQSVGTLAGGVAHEFNNLLAGIQGYANPGRCARSRAWPGSVREFLEYIGAVVSDRAANLTRQLLAFARKPSLFRPLTDEPGTPAANHSRSGAAQPEYRGLFSNLEAPGAGRQRAPGWQHLPTPTSRSKCS